MKFSEKSFTRRTGVLLLGLGLALSLWILSWPGEQLPQAQNQPLVALVIMDTVRRDHIEPCGEMRPVTPNLASLARQATTYCGTVAPGSWTPPVHSAIFTGALPIETGAMAGGAFELLDSGVYVSPMRSDLPTFAELYGRAGYQTVLISGNPVLHPATGLTRGFDEIWVTPDWFSDSRAFVAPRLEDFLTSGRIDPSRPLLLVINTAIAHDEYEPVPANVSWLDESTMPIGWFLNSPESLWSQYNSGALSPTFASRLLTEARRAYTWGVHLADRDLGAMLQLLRRSGWLGKRANLFVTSDHGEMLGEDRQLGHGGTVALPVVNVFTLAVGPSFERGEVSYALNQSQDLFSTILRVGGIRQEVARPTAIPLGRQDADRIAISFTERNLFRDGGLRVAVQQGTRRVVLSSEGWSVEQDLAAGTESQEISSASARLLEIATQHGTRRPTSETPIRLPDELEKSLRAVGYIQ